MKCPVLRHAEMSSGTPYLTEGSDCLKEECAWWDGRFSQCIIFTSAEALYNLRNDIKDIKDKMPHEGQFRK